MTQDGAMVAIEVFVRSVYLPGPHIQRPDGWEAAPLRASLLLKLDGQPTLRLPLRHSALCLAPLVAEAGRPAGGSPGVSRHTTCTSGSSSSPVRFEQMLMVQAAGRWQLPGWPSAAEAGHAAVPVHLVVVEDSRGSPAASSGAALSPAGSGGSPPTVRGVGSLLLDLPSVTSSGSYSSGGSQLPGAWRSPAPTQRPPIQQEPLRCCRFVCPATGAEAGSISLAVRLVHLTPDVPAAAQQPQQPAQAQTAPAVPQPEQAGEASKRSPRQQPQRRKLRSAGVQASPAATDGQTSCQAVPSQHGAVGLNPLLLLPPAVCTAGVAVQGSWCAVQGIPPAAPVLGVPVQPQLPPALLAPDRSAAWSIPAPAPQLPLVLPVSRLQLPCSASVPLAACPVAPLPDPLAPRVAAIRTRVEQQAAQQQRKQGVEHAAGRPAAVAEGTEPLCTLRSPLKVASRPPPAQHYLREAASPRRCTSPLKRHEAMASSALGRPASSRAGRPASPGCLGGAPPQFCCPGCLEPFLRLPGSPTKRGQLATAVRQRLKPGSSCCPHCTSLGQQSSEQQQPPSQQAQQLERAQRSSPGHVGGSSSRRSTQHGSGGEAADPSFERLLLQLNLRNSDWRGLLMRSLQGALDAADSGGGSTAASAPAAADGAATAGSEGSQPHAHSAGQVAPAACGPPREAQLLWAEPKGKAMQAGSLPATPRIRAGRRGSNTAADAPAGAGPAVAANEEAAQRGVAVPRAQVASLAADTLRQVVTNNRQLIRRQLAAASGSGQGVQQRERTRSAQGAEAGVAVATATAGCEAPAARHASQLPVPGDHQVESADDVVARLQCHQASYSSSGGGSISGGGGGQSMDIGSEGGANEVYRTSQQPSDNSDLLCEQQPSQSTLVSFGCEWERPRSASGGRGADAAQSNTAQWRGSSDVSECYEDDFEPE